MNALTIALGLVLVGVIVYAVGVERTTTATKRGAQTTKRKVSKTAGLAVAGGSLGLATGDAVLQFVMSDPATLLAGVIGGLGALGLGGVLDLTPLQYGIAVAVLLVGYAAWQTEDD